MPRLVDQPGSVRLVAACFALMVLGFALLAQINLWEQAGGGRLPTPEEVLWKYHGKPDSSRLHTVLDAELPDDHALAMWPFLGVDTEIAPAREAILGWVEAGAPESAWDAVGPLFTGLETCGQCHAPDGQKEDAPLTTYAEVLPYTRQDTGMAKGPLLISAHNHWFGFTVLALLLSVGLLTTRVRGLPRVALVLAIFVGPALDVGGWLLTSSLGAPFQFAVILGGALFGAASGVMALAILVDALRLRVR